jgi:hypothetical protein
MWLIVTKNSSFERGNLAKHQGDISLKHSDLGNQAGIHAKAILNNPSTYEIINPADFGMTRYVHFASRLTGWNAIKSRAAQLNIEMTDEQYKECTAKIKALAGQNILSSLTSPMLLYPRFLEH